MKKKLFRLLTTLLLLALMVAAFAGMMQLSNLHRAEYPWLYAGNAPQNLLPVIGAVLCLGLFGLFAALCAKVCGYQFVETHLVFLHIRKEEGRLRFRLGRPSLGTLVLPPRTDGTSPWRLFIMIRPLFFGLITLLFLLLTFSARGTTTFRSLLLPMFCYLGLTLISLLPRKNGLDPLSLWQKFSRSRDCLRAWECTSHIASALHQGQKLMDMPEEWFQSYPTEVAHDPYVSNCLINGSSRLMRQYRFDEAYASLQPLFDLTPAPHTHQLIAVTILNGAICEAMLGIPAFCLDRLEHPSVQYMTPPAWKPRVLTARYARALLITHDEQEAARLLPELRKLGEEDQVDVELVRLMQEKAGVIPHAEQ